MNHAYWLNETRAFYADSRAKLGRANRERNKPMRIAYLSMVSKDRARLKRCIRDAETALGRPHRKIK